MTTPSELGQLIRQERKRQHLTQEMLAGLVGVGPRLIGEIENGKESAEIGKVFHVLAILGIDLTATPRDSGSKPGRS